MINFYNKKCPEILDVILAAGHYVEEIDGVLVTSNDVIVQSIIDGFTLTDLINVRCSYVDKLATNKRNKVIATYSPGEMAAWPIKRSEAILYKQTSTPTDAPYLANEAAIRGITLVSLVDKVIADATTFSNIEAAIAGTSGKHRDAIKSLTTFEQVMNYNYTTGWPL